jgi:hypothetical protein
VGLACSCRVRVASFSFRLWCEGKCYFLERMGVGVGALGRCIAFSLFGWVSKNHVVALMSRVGVLCFGGGYG